MTNLPNEGPPVIVSFITAVAMIAYGVYGFVAKKMWARGIQGPVTPTRYPGYYWTLCILFTVGGCVLLYLRAQFLK